jgi:hypothetical protein
LTTISSFVARLSDDSYEVLWSISGAGWLLVREKMDFESIPIASVEFRSKMQRQSASVIELFMKY